jgi:hypothetical protein
MFARGHRRRPLIYVSVALSTLVLTARAQDLAIVPANPLAETMVGVSPVIFTGIVSELRYSRHPNSRIPFTFVRFSGVEYLRKDSPVATEKDGSIEISVAGGMRDNLHMMEVDELPKFALGQRHLIFLRGGGWRFTPIAGFEAGVFRLHGSLKSDAFILDYGGTPVGGIKDGRFFEAPKSKVESSAQDRFQSGLQENSLSPELDRDLRQISDRFKDRSARDQFEKELSEREVKEAQHPIVKEDDQSSGGIAGYGNVMRVSQ